MYIIYDPYSKELGRSSSASIALALSDCFPHSHVSLELDPSENGEKKKP